MTIDVNSCCDILKKKEQEEGYEKKNCVCVFVCVVKVEFLIIERKGHLKKNKKKIVTAPA